MTIINPLKRKTVNSILASLIIFSCLASTLSSCILITESPTPLPTEVPIELTPIVTNSVTQVTLVSETEAVPEKPTISLTSEPPMTETEIPTQTVNPDIELVDEELAENIKNLMPKMWFYNDVSKKFEVRNSDEFTFLIYKKTKLLIFDMDGNEVGFASHFVETSPNAQMTDYFSLTDISRDTIIPIRLYSEMGNYTSRVYFTDGWYDTKQCMYGFVDQYTERKLDTVVYPQDVVDMFRESDIGNIQKGEKIVETAI